MAGGGKGGGKGGKGGSSGQASNADLQDDEDVMNRMVRGHNFREWAKKKRGEGKTGAFIHYENSPPPPKR